MCNVQEARNPILKGGPLKLVICQLRFPKVLGLSESELRPFQAGLQDYPEYQPGEVQELLVGAGVIRPSPDPERLYQFSSSDENWKVSLTSTALSLETQVYAGFQDFSRRWEAVLKQAQAALKIHRQDRLGLRFINEIPLPGDESAEAIKKLVRPELIAVIGAHPRTHRVLQSLQEMRIEQDDGICTLRHGLIQKTTTERTYLIDLDYYNESKKPLTIAQHMASLTSFNAGLYDLFRWSITDLAYESFQPQAAVGQ